MISMTDFFSHAPRYDGRVAPSCAPSRKYAMEYVLLIAARCAAIVFIVFAARTRTNDLQSYKLEQTNPNVR